MGLLWLTYKKFFGGPMDGRTAEETFSCRYVSVPIDQERAAEWEVRKTVPRIRPRGLRSAVYENKGSHYEWVRVEG